MWIALGIIGFLAMLITVIVLLPVKIIIKNDANNVLILRYQFLGKVYGENPNPDDPIIKMLKTATGAERLEKKMLKQSVQTEGLQKTVSESYTMLIDLIKELLFLIKRGAITRLQVKILCAGSSADQVAIHYGQCCSVTYSLLHALRNFVRIRKRGCHIDIRSDFTADKSVFRYDVLLRLRFGPVLAAFWRVALAEAKRARPQQK